MKKKYSKLVYWLPVLIWMGVIFFLSTLPDAETPFRYTIPDKILHGTEYFILAFFIYIAFQRTTNLRFITTFLITVVWVALYGLSDEFHQLHVPTRNFDLWDLFADVTGAVILLISMYLLPRIGKRSKKLYLLLTGRDI